MHNVTRAAVPRLGDWCAIFVLPDPDALVPDIDIAHVDPEMTAYARKLQTQITDEAAFKIARRSRGTPRIANSRLWWARSFAASEHEGPVTLEIAQAALNRDLPLIINVTLLITLLTVAVNALAGIAAASPQRPS